MVTIFVECIDISKIDLGRFKTKVSLDLENYQTTIKSMGLRASENYRILSRFIKSRTFVLRWVQSICDPGAICSSRKPAPRRIHWFGGPLQVSASCSPSSKCTTGLPCRSTLLARKTLIYSISTIHVRNTFKLGQGKNSNQVGGVIQKLAPTIVTLRYLNSRLHLWKDFNSQTREQSTDRNHQNNSTWYFTYQSSWTATGNLWLLVLQNCPVKNVVKLKTCKTISSLGKQKWHCNKLKIIKHSQTICSLIEHSKVCA